jgi:hypothetical protein
MLQRAGVAMDSVSDDSESSGDEAASAKSDAGSDSLNFREWAEVAAEAAEEEDIAPPTEAELREGFAALDADGSGTVSLAELGAAVGGRAAQARVDAALAQGRAPSHVDLKRVAGEDDAGCSDGDDSSEEGSSEEGEGGIPLHALQVGAAVRFRAAAASEFSDWAVRGDWYEGVVETIDAPLPAGWHSTGGCPACAAPDVATQLQNRQRDLLLQLDTDPEHTSSLAEMSRVSEALGELASGAHESVVVALGLVARHSKLCWERQLGMAAVEAAHADHLAGWRKDWKTAGTPGSERDSGGGAAGCEARALVRYAPPFARYPPEWRRPSELRPPGPPRLPRGDASTNSARSDNDSGATPLAAPLRWRDLTATVVGGLDGAVVVAAGLRGGHISVVCAPLPGWASEAGLAVGDEVVALDRIRVAGQPAGFEDAARGLRSRRSVVWKLRRLMPPRVLADAVKEIRGYEDEENERPDRMGPASTLSPEAEEARSQYMAWRQENPPQSM